MLIPVVALYIVCSIFLTVVCIVKHSKAALTALISLWWIAGGISAVFTCWAWMDRGYSENWALIGFMFVSLPIIASTLVMAVTLVVLGRVRRIGPVQKAGVSIYLLTGFLVIQTLAGWWAA